MAIAPFVYMPLPSLGMSSHLMDYGGGGGGGGGGYNRISLYHRSSHEAYDHQMQGFYGGGGEQDTAASTGRGKGLGGVGDNMFRVKQEPYTDQDTLDIDYPLPSVDPQQGPGGGGGIPGGFPEEHALTKYHQAGKMFALGKHREKDLVNREKEFIAMVLFQNGDNERGGSGGGGYSQHQQRLSDCSGSSDGKMSGSVGGGGGAGDEAYDLSRRGSTVGSTGSSPGSMSPPSPLSRSALMPSPASAGGSGGAGIPSLSHSPLPFMSAAAGMPLSPMSSLLLSPSSPGMPPSPLPPYHAAAQSASQTGNGLYYYNPRGHHHHHHHHHHHPMHHGLYNGRTHHHHHGGKLLPMHVSKSQTQKKSEKKKVLVQHRWLLRYLLSLTIAVNKKNLICSFFSYS